MMSIKHAKATAVVRKADWNADHVITDIVLADGAGASAYLQILNQTTFPGSFVLGNGGRGITVSAPWPIDPLSFESNGSVAGQGNVLVGIGAGVGLTSGNGNVCIGYGAGRDATIATQSTFIGWNTGKLVTSAYHNVAIGACAAENQTSGNYNTYVGTDVALWKQSGEANAYFGASAGSADLTGIGNTFLGTSTGGTGGNYNLFAGYSAGAANAASQNIGLGPFALLKTTTGTLNIAIGYEALLDNVSGSGNVGIGHQSLSLTTSNDNTAIGSKTLWQNVSGAVNTAIGSSALAANTGSFNTAVGASAARCNIGGAQNSAVGYQALYSNTTGSNTVALGYRAGMYQANGSTALADPENSVYLGTESRGLDDADSNSIVIGYLAIGAGANKAVLGNASVTDVYLGSAAGLAILHAATLALTAGAVTYGADNSGGAGYRTLLVPNA
jgi:hypothetical protein